ncbi:MAG: hypothetical protein DWQ07_02010 [Chloroflexi bacterium]|nr:MAG: hypothetical protein DWQ07_02010 [Chloroflexota bacterium]MBL1193726.1 hypothetical protein [Chloroflexota bacterium]
MFVGGLPLLMGAFIVLLSLDIIPSDESAFHAPRWVVAVAGGVFKVAGMAVIWQNSFTHLQETTWYQTVSHLLIGGIFLSFALVFNWVAFGPGEREFSSSVSIPFISVENTGSNASSGRFFFGVFALMLDIGVIYALYFYLKKLWNWVVSEE